MSSLTAIFAPGGDFGGLLALAVVMIGMPFLLKGLRLLPARQEALWVSPAMGELAVEKVESDEA
jgi:hypothetical protein